MTSRYAKNAQGTGWWRRPGRISVEEAEHGYKYFRIIPPSWHEKARDYDRYLNIDRFVPARVLIEKPAIPGVTYHDEDKTIPRVSLAPGIWEALAGLNGKVSRKSLMRSSDEREWAGGMAHQWLVYGTNKVSKLISNKEVQKYVPDAAMTGELWSLGDVRMNLIGSVGGGFWDELELGGEDGDGQYYIWICPEKGTVGK